MFLNGDRKKSYLDHIVRNYRQYRGIYIYRYSDNEEIGRRIAMAKSALTGLIVILERPSHCQRRGRKSAYLQNNNFVTNMSEKT